MIINLPVTKDDLPIIKNKFHMMGKYPELNSDLRFNTYIAGAFAATLATTVTAYLIENLFFGGASSSKEELLGVLEDF